jgi:hypothetical protein
MSAFQVVVVCHRLSRQKGSALLVSSTKEDLSILKYADHSRICSILHGFFGNISVLHGARREYTDAVATGDNTGTIWSLPEEPCLLSIEDIADSILACHKAEVCQRLRACIVDDDVVTT